MACITKRRGKYVVDFRDGTGRRRWITCSTRKEAEKELERALGDSRRKRRPSVDPKVSVADYATSWLAVMAPIVKPATVTSYTDTFRLHIAPVFGRFRLDQLERGAMRARTDFEVSARRFRARTQLGNERPPPRA